MQGVGGWRAAVVVVVVCLVDTSRALTLPGMDQACGNLGPGECMARVSKCKMVGDLAKGKGGYVKPVLDCATTLGIPKMQVVGVIGPAFSAGQPETIVDRITNDSAISAQLHQCVNQANGLVSVLSCFTTTCCSGLEACMSPCTVPPHKTCVNLLV
ncbi:hypothetical protein E2C01_078704 [Portunus trituberculatus]|uniref:Uncharacterized protein n=1 Tax=Portunus trituberculatus TaxID=210409 RepID=A0A5B7IHK4_PORTR|nr:hypothetical protein [Portunus trituberculatus]